MPSPEDALRELQQISDAALASLSMNELLRELLDRIAAILGTDTAAFLLLDEVAGDLVAQAAKGIEEEVERGVRIPVGRGFAGRIAAERRAVAIEDVDHADILNPILREKGIRSLLGVPLLVEQRVIGVLHVGSLQPRHFTDQERDLLQLAADRAAIAIEHSRLHAQRHIVEAMQRAMLPSALPVIPGIELTARYLPAAVDARVGGDWYDVFELGRGRIALVIGDVVGRGVEAGALMAQVRTALRAYALEGHPPAMVVELLNRLFASVRPVEADDAGLPRSRPRGGRAADRQRRPPAADRRRRRRARAAARRGGRPARGRVQGRLVRRAPRGDRAGQQHRARHRRRGGGARGAARRRPRAPARCCASRSPTCARCAARSRAARPPAARATMMWPCWSRASSRCPSG